MSTTPRPLRRLRRALAMLGALTVLLVAAAVRLESAGRAVAAVAAFACLVAWMVLLEREGRTADRLDAHAHRRTALQRPTRAASRPRPAGRRDRRAA